MAAGVAILVLVSAGRLGGPGEQAMLDAAREIVGPSTISMDAIDSVPADDDAVLLADMLAVDALVEVIWPDAADDRAQLRVFVRRHQTWINRDITFRAVDAGVDRGRTVGFVFGAMIPQALEKNPTNVSTSAAENPWADAASPDTASAAPPRDRPTPRAIAPSEPGSRPFALEAYATTAATTGLVLFGGGIGARWSAPNRWSFGAIVDARTGDVDGADARMLDLRAAAAVGREIRLGRGLELHPRMEMFMTRSAVSRPAAPDVTVARWIPGIAAAVELGWWLTSSTSMALMSGVDAHAHEARVVVGDEVVGQVPRLRGFVRFGVRVRF